MTKLYEARNHILLQAEYANPVEHCHMAAHIMISMDDKMMVMSNGMGRHCHGVMIPSGVSHMVDTNKKAVLVFLYDCTTDVAKQIQDIQYISEECCKNIAAWYHELERESTADSYSTFEKRVWNCLGILSSGGCVTDERIVSAIQYIRSRAGERISCQEAADAVCLSQSRFSHLFKEQVGMTFASYLIYQRLMHGYAEILQGKSITEAALEAGFSSSTHFADVNLRVFGISASSITQNLIFCKVS